MKRTMISFVTILSLILLTFSLVPSERGDREVEGAATRGEIGGVFTGEEIYRSSRSLSGGMGTGDVDRDGDTEIVFCDFEGNVIILEPGDDGGFDPNVIWQAEGSPGSNRTLFDLVVADVDPDRNGLEIITAGDVGTPLKEIYLIWWSGTDWVSEAIHRGPFRTFELEIGDVDPAPGDEILFGSLINDQDNPDKYLRYLYRDTSGNWVPVEIELPYTVKAIEVGDADPTIPGEEIWVSLSGWNAQGGIESNLTQLYRQGDQWVQRLVYQNPTALVANVRIGELWSGHMGNEVIIAELSGWCRVIYYHEGEFVVEDIFQSDTISGQSSGLEGLAIGDFNPLNDGDEAVVTGYYNKVTQIIEVDGQVEDDIAWSKTVQDPRLEISGVEVGDVSDLFPGNEVLVASLQGWIELLRYQEDGISIDARTNLVEMEDGGEIYFDIEVVPEGRFTGAVTVVATEPYGINVELPSSVELGFQERETVTLVIEADELGGESRTSEIEITATSGEFIEVWTLTVVVTVLEEIEMVVDPLYGTIYKEGVNTHVSTISISGGSRYDYIDLAATDVDGLSVSVNTPIVPGSEQEITVSVEGEPSVGTHAITITASYNGLTVGQGSLLVSVVSLEESFEISYRPVAGERNSYLVHVNFTGPVSVRMVTIDIEYGNEILMNEPKDLAPGDRFTVTMTPEEGEEAGLMVFIKTLSGETVRSEYLGNIEYRKEEDQGFSSIWLAAIIIIVFGILIVIAISIFYKPSENEEEDLQDIGAPRRYSPGRGPLGPERERSSEIRGGRLGPGEDREPRGRSGIRRAPSRPESEGPGPRGKEIRRAPPAPDHLRPGGRQREVRRAPPRR